jgi:ABC-type multidrug transport system ATPase subunit
MLRLGDRNTKDEIEFIVEDTLIRFSLKKVEHVKIGVPGHGISGGERKRLSLAVECLSKPAVLICDEPISGSDAYMANMLIDLLIKLVKRSKEEKSRKMAVIMTVHQPSSLLYYRYSIYNRPWTNHRL